MEIIPSWLGFFGDETLPAIVGSSWYSPFLRMPLNPGFHEMEYGFRTH